MNNHIVLIIRVGAEVYEGRYRVDRLVPKVGASAFGARLVRLGLAGPYAYTPLPIPDELQANCTGVTESGAVRRLYDDFERWARWHAAREN
jgi:hypothetical protein